MTTHVQETSVTTSADVDAPVEHAFRVFTEAMVTWWHPDHHLIPDVTEMEFEPFVGGHIIDRSADGGECRWSRVLVYEPPSRVVFSWDVNLQWQLETDPEKASEVEVTFTPDGPARTIVVLTHRHLDRHGDGWQGMRDAVGSGWSLARFAEAAAAG